ncbi:MAG: polyketide cyclase / dehydrase and lipid transport [Segniliparus sp.]|uniref:polyketide cyclase / dehydrase and lipid transport n=1 Tax=Segniliparus sp. TaxID=2804064 RepID=UPI003F316887
MHSIQVADQTFVAAPPSVVGQSLEAPGDWRRWWPELDLQVREARGEKGVRWLVNGQVQGTMEVWLKPELDGTLLHFFLHAEPPAPLRPGELRRLVRDLRLAGKAMSFELKDRCEAGKQPGHAPRVRTTR